MPEINLTPLVLLGSARRAGNTGAFAQEVLTGIDYHLINLLDYTVAPYDYQDCYPAQDQFLQIIDQLLAHPVLIFATPVYWYAMSGPLKIFFDRITDITTTRKHLDKQLKGKRVFLLAVGEEKELPLGFEIPFQQTAAYLGMTYETSIYYAPKYSTAAENQSRLDLFTARLQAALELNK